MIGSVPGAGFPCAGVPGAAGAPFIGGLASAGLCPAGKAAAPAPATMVGLGEGGSRGGWVPNGAVICGLAGGCGVTVPGDRTDSMPRGEATGLGRAAGMVGVMRDTSGAGGWLGVGG